MPSFSFTPSSGPPGTPVTVTCVGLSNVSAVTFNGVPATFVVVSGPASTYEAQVPLAGGSGVVAVTGTEGTFSGGSFIVGFRWTLTDPAVPESYTFEYNPGTQTPLPLQKAVSAQSTTAPDGTAIFYEGSDTPELGSLTFKVLSQAQYNHLKYWYSKRRQVLLIDDLGNASWVYFTTFVPTRVQSKNYPWRHDITMAYYTFGQQAVTAL